MLTSCMAGRLISSMKLQHAVLVAGSEPAYLLSTFTSPPINSGMRMLMNATANALCNTPHRHNAMIVMSKTYIERDRVQHTHQMSCSCVMTEITQTLYKHDSDIT